MAGAGRGWLSSQMWRLGDVVGCGPDPAECLRLLRDFDLTAVAGNHDYAAAGVIDAADFNGAAYPAIRWTGSGWTPPTSGFCPNCNPGSAGQPRDRAPRASYAVYDSGGPAIEHYRIEYNIAATQAKMRHANLPQYLIDRLEYGV